VDFTVDPQGRVDWTLGIGLGTAPVEGARYSMSYYAHLAYVVVSHPHDFRDTITQIKQPEPSHTPMLVQAMARLEFYGRADQ